MEWSTANLVNRRRGNLARLERAVRDGRLEIGRDYTGPALVAIIGGKLGDGLERLSYQLAERQHPLKLRHLGWRGGVAASAPKLYRVEMR